jgi:hypothetical protein
MLAERLQFIPASLAESLLQQLAEVGRLVSGLANSLRT